MADPFHSLPDEVLLLVLQHLPFDPRTIFAARGTCRRFRDLICRCKKFDEQAPTEWSIRAIDADEDDALLIHRRCTQNIPALLLVFGVCRALQQAPLFALQSLDASDEDPLPEDDESTARFQVALEVERHRTLRHALFLLLQLRTALIGYSSLTNVALVRALGSHIEELEMRQPTTAAVLALAAIPARTCLRNLTLVRIATDAQIQRRAPIGSGGLRGAPQFEAACAALQCTLAVCTNLQELTLRGWQADLLSTPSPGVNLQQARVRCHELCLRLHGRLAARWDGRLPAMPLSAVLAPPQLPALRRLELHSCLQVSDEALATLAAAAPHLRTLALFDCDGGEDGDEGDGGDAAALTAAGWDAGVMQMRSLRVLLVAGNSTIFARAAERGAVQAGHLLISTRSGEGGHTPVCSLEAAAAELGGSPPPLLVHTWREIEEDINGDYPHCEHTLHALHIVAPRGGVPLLPLLRHVRMCNVTGLVRLYGMHVDFGALTSIWQLRHLLCLDLASCTVDLHTLPAMLRRCRSLEEVSFSHGCRIAPFPHPCRMRFKRQLVIPIDMCLRLDMTGLDLRGVSLAVEMRSECMVLLPSHHVATEESLEIMEMVLESVLEPCGSCRFGDIFRPRLQPLQLHEWQQLRGGGNGHGGGHGDSHGGSGGCDCVAAASPAHTPTSLEPRDMQFPADTIRLYTKCTKYISLRVNVGGRHRALDFWAQGVEHVELDIRFAERGASYSVWRRFPTAVDVYIAVDGMAADLDCSDMPLLEHLHISGSCNMLRLDVSRCPHLDEVDTGGLVSPCFVTADGCPLLRQ